MSFTDIKTLSTSVAMTSAEILSLASPIDSTVICCLTLCYLGSNVFFTEFYCDFRMLWRGCVFRTLNLHLFLKFTGYLFWLIHFLCWGLLLLNQTLVHWPQLWVHTRCQKGRKGKAPSKHSMKQLFLLDIQNWQLTRSDNKLAHR